MATRVFSKRLKAELEKVQETYNVEIVNGNISEWQVEIEVDGYGSLDLLITFPSNYPFSPPKVVIPRIFHPNVYKTGVLCMSILHGGSQGPGDMEGLDEKWSAGIWMESLIISICSVLISPNLDSPANVDARKMFTNNHPEYKRKNEDLAIARINEKIKKEQNQQFEEAQRLDKQREENRRAQLLDSDEGNVTTLAEAPSTVDHTPDTEQTEKAAMEKTGVDSRKPVANIQVRLADGSRLMVKLNQESTVADLRMYINIARPQYNGEAYALLTTFPNKELTDDTATITCAGLDGAVVIQRQE